MVEDTYNVSPQLPSYNTAAPTQQMGATSTHSNWRALVDPSNPLVWFGGILLVTVGAAGVAGSVRLGRAKISANVGNA